MLKTSRWILRVLNWLNWGVGVPIVILLIIASTIGAAHIVAASGPVGTANPQALISVLRWGAALTVPMIALAHIIFTRLIAIIDTVPSGTAFSAINADRLRVIAWALLGTQAIDVVSGIYTIIISQELGRPAPWSPSLTGWIAVLLLFVLARIFQQGAAMRDELEGTV